MAILRAETKWSLGVFFVAAAFVLWSAGSRFVLSNNDEGIYLASAMRLLHGEIPYRDFFYYLPPATLLVHAGAMRVFGEKLWAARVPLGVDVGILAACAFWLTARLASLRAAFVTAFCFLAFETAEHDRLVTDHRWDSSALATLAIVLTVSLLDSPPSRMLKKGTDRSVHAERSETNERLRIGDRVVGPLFQHPARVRAACAGFCAALAVWMTTPVAIAAAVIFIAAVAIERLRPALMWMATGAVACSAGMLAWLAAHGDVGAFWSAILWPARHYAGANRTPYGWVIGGYANLFQGISGRDAVFVAIFVAFLTLPATLPVFSLIGWPIRLRNDRKEPRGRIVFLLAAMLALIASTLPRPDLIHLMYISPIAYALGVALMTRVLPPRALATVAAVSVLMAATDYGIACNRRVTEAAMSTQIGMVRGTAGDLSVLRLVTGHVRPGDTFFAFPYWPNFYFPAGARNPTRFAYLQPGMFSVEEERAALGDLERSPPRWILYVATPPESYLRIWPGSDPARLRFSSIENFIADHYRSVEKAGTFDLRAMK